MAALKYLMLTASENAEEITMDKKFAFSGGLKDCCLLECGHIKRDIPAINIPTEQFNYHLAEFSFDKSKLASSSFVDPLNRVFNWLVLSEDFIASLGGNDGAFANASFGNLISPNGDVLKGGRVLFANEEVIVRGGPAPANQGACYAPKYNVCSKCERVNYFCFSPDNLFPAPPAEKKLIFPANGMGIVIRIDSEQEIDHFYGIAKGRCSIKELDVLDKPRDGINAILEPYRVKPLGDQTV